MITMVTSDSTIAVQDLSAQKEASTMVLRGLLFTFDQRVVADMTRAGMGLGVHWFFAACPEQAAAVIAQSELDLLVIDCDSIAGRELAVQVQRSQHTRSSRLLCLSSDDAGIPATVLHKPLDNQTLTSKLRESLPLF